MDTCSLCTKRRPQRDCPGTGSQICSRCCGEERENSIDCPLDCEYLRQARRREKPRDFSPDETPHGDIQVTERFLDENESLVGAFGQALARIAVETPTLVDYDVREALDSMIRTYRTLESGLIYETRPGNPFAAGIQQRLNAFIEQLRRKKSESAPMSAIRDKDILGILVFFQRIEYGHNNGRRRGRAFLDMLREGFPPGDAQPRQPLVVPQQPL